MIFRNIVGCRIIDESHISEFWNTYSEPNGWLWEVNDGGWLALERNRETFDPPHISLREFFIVGNYCINVLSPDYPEITDLGTDPERPG